MGQIDGKACVQLPSLHSPLCEPNNSGYISYMIDDIAKFWIQVTDEKKGSKTKPKFRRAGGGGYIVSPVLTSLLCSFVPHASLKTDVQIILFSWSSKWYSIRLRACCFKAHHRATGSTHQGKDSFVLSCALQRRSGRVVSMAFTALSESFLMLKRRDWLSWSHPFSTQPGCPGML